MRTRNLKLLLAVLACQSLSAASLASLPLSFEPDLGQGPAGVRFLARRGKLELFLTDRGFAAPQGLRIDFAGASRGARAAGIDPLPGKSNYFIGNDPAKWRTNVPNFARVRYEGLYKGVDLVFYGTEREVEYDFVVHPGADPGRIKLVIRGTRAARLSESGDIVLGVGLGEVRLRRPRAYQDVDGRRREVGCHYEFKPGQAVGFRLGPYEAGRDLVIDPVLVYSTYFGGSGSDVAAGVAVDPAGNIYIAGMTYSPDLPTSAGALQPQYQIGQCRSADSTPYPCRQVFVAKLNAAGTALQYCTYLGGNQGAYATGIAVDQEGNAYVAGVSYSADFPLVTPLPTSAAQGFLSKLNGDGSALLYSTWLDAMPVGVAVDHTGSAYICGTAPPGVPLVHALQDHHAAAALWASSDSGANWHPLPLDTDVEAIAVDPQIPGRVYVAGSAYPNEGVFRSNDRGATWQSSGGTFAHFVIEALAVDPANPATVYAGTARGVFKSTDGGNSWASASSGLNTLWSSQITTLVFGSGAPNTLYAGTFGGLYKSVDAGSTWQPTSFVAADTWDDAEAVFAVAVDPGPPSLLYASGHSGVAKIADAGATWSLANNGLPSGHPMCTLAIDPVVTSTVYAGGCTWGTLYKSTDSGATWRALETGLSWISALLIDPSNGSHIYAGGPAIGGHPNLVESYDAGQTWSPLTRDLPYAWISALAVDLRGGTIYAGLRYASEDDAFVAKLNPQGSGFVYSTYLGGSASDRAAAIAVDGSGNAYITGATDSVDFPVRNAVQSRKAGALDGFVAVLNPTGSLLVYSTFIGGSSFDTANATAVDLNGAAYVAGSTTSSDFPTANAVQSRYGGSGIHNQGDVFVAKLAAGGTSLAYSTYLGGTDDDFAGSIGVDSTGSAVVAGSTSSLDFPLVNALPGIPDAPTQGFVAKLSPAGERILYSTLFGGSAGNVSTTAVAVDAAGTAIIAGTTSSPDFPMRNPLQPALRGAPDVFVAKIAGAPPPQIPAGSVVNAASYRADAVTPGALVSIFGTGLAQDTRTATELPLPFVLAGSRVTFNGVPAPLLYASPGQINAQVPFETGPGPATVEVTTALGAATETVTLRDTAAGLFSTNAQGTGPGAILHAGDFQPVTEAYPARAGEMVSIFCTGLGATSPPVATGAPAPAGETRSLAQPTAVIIGWQPATVTYSGLAPGFVGLYQLNVQVPSGNLHGAQTVQVWFAASSSNTVTMVIQ